MKELLHFMIHFNESQNCAGFYLHCCVALFSSFICIKHGKAIDKCNEKMYEKKLLECLLHRKHSVGGDYYYHHHHYYYYYMRRREINSKNILVPLTLWQLVIQKNWNLQNQYVTCFSAVESLALPQPVLLHSQAICWSRL